MKESFKELYRYLYENKGLFFSFSSIAVIYGCSLLTGRGDILSPVGHFLLGPFFKEVGSSISKYLRKGKSKSAYELGSVVGGNFSFQLLKCLGYIPLPGIGDEFEIPSILYGITGGLVAMVYERRKK